MHWLDKWGGLSLLIVVWLLSRHFFGFEVTVIVMLATVLWGQKL